MLELRPAMLGDTWLCLPTIRQSDIDELAAIGKTPEECIRLGILSSFDAAMITINDEPAGVVGVINYGEFNLIWACFCTVIERHPIPFLRACKRWLKDKGPLLNYVDARQSRTIEWLQWIGFSVDPEPVPYGLQGEPFHKFWRD
jgi:hypothetical protein